MMANVRKPLMNIYTLCLIFILIKRRNKCFALLVAMTLMGLSHLYKQGSDSNSMNLMRCCAKHGLQGDKSMAVGFGRLSSMEQQAMI